MQEPANLALVVLCQERAMKQESIVYQFQSIEILQVGAGGVLPLPIPPESLPWAPPPWEPWSIDIVADGK